MNTLNLSDDLNKISCYFCKNLFTKRFLFRHTSKCPSNPEFGTPCVECGTLKHPSKKTCSKSCKIVYQSGANNSNYGNKWTKEKKEKQSEIIKSKIDEEYRQRVGSANRGKKFSKERIQAMHSHRDPSSYRRIHSEDTKKIIGKKSKQKFTEEFKLKQREKFIELGYWRSDLDKKEYDIYIIHSEWIKPMWELANRKLLNELGIFNPKNNKTGLVRDHIFSRKHGFENKVFPEILRHPANCQIITHSENSSKREKSDLTLEELFNKIETYDREWEEQELIISLINKWRNGKKFSADEYRR